MAIITSIRNPQYPACDNAAVAAGFTRHMIADGGGYYGSVALLVKPDADLDSVIPAFDTDEQEWVIVQGFNCDWSDVE